MEMKTEPGGILFKEKENESKVAVIVIQGMADLGEVPNKMIADVLEADVYDPKWHDNDDPDIASKKPYLEKRLRELDEVVERHVEDGRIVVLVGVSAGAGLAMCYMKEHPDKVRHIFSVGGVLNPNPDLEGGKFPDLLKDSQAFTEMTNELDQWYKEPGVTEKLKKEKKVTAYISSKLGVDGDGTVPGEALAPKWARITKVGDLDHVFSIIKGLLGTVKGQLEQLREAEID